jgi:3-hydroxyacyl-[acyl-carrier-protein] dehydratase
VTEAVNEQFASALESLPHRPPFRFLDRIDALSDESARGAWIVRGDEDFLRGHFPGRPLVPGVLITEAAAQLAGVVAHRHVGGDGGGMLVLSESRFRRPVEPPSTILLEVTSIGRFGSIHRFDFEAMVDGTRVASGSVGVSLQSDAEDGTS